MDYRLLIAGFLLGLLFDSADGGDALLRNFDGLLSKYTALQHKKKPLLFALK
jgi:hypothetical protein